ncbi:MAG: diacylglycerol kinase family protein [Anaerolineae bacterium]|nr:diacylglycerol kinase family protein [Anaerolineae bacterium]
MRSGYQRRDHRGNLVSSIAFALAGLSYVLQSERNARIHLIIAALVVVCGLWVGISPYEWALLTLTIALVFCSEVLNTAIELMVDIAQPERDLIAKHAKDMAAGATLVAALAAAIVGVLILGPKLWARMAL